MLFNLAFKFTASIWPMASVIYSLVYMITHQENTIQMENLRGDCDFKRALDIEESLIEFVRDSEDGDILVNATDYDQNARFTVVKEVVERHGKKYRVSASLKQYMEQVLERTISDASIKNI